MQGFNDTLTVTDDFQLAEKVVIALKVCALDRAVPKSKTFLLPEFHWIRKKHHCCWCLSEDTPDNFS